MVGMKKRHVADRVGVGEATIYRWMSDEEFRCELDRLTFITGMAVKAARVRAIKRLIRSRMDEDEVLDSKRDVLDWIKLLKEEINDMEVSAFLAMTLGNALDELGNG